MNRTIKYIVDINSNNQTIESFLRERGFSRHILTQLKQTENGIRINGTWERTNYLLKEGDELTIHYLEEHSSPNIVPVCMNLTILYEDEDLMILNKPADLPVHPSQGNFNNTLANGLAYYFKERGESFIFRCINRLDRDTTGLLLVAKNGISSAILSDQMKHRKIKRTYQAIVSGFTAPCGTICAPIARMSGSTIARCVDFIMGETAVTHYRTVSHLLLSNPTSPDKKGRYSLVSIQLKTGRTHQIRVHMNYIGHPLPGDFLYHADYSIFQRQPLHSCELRFVHPLTGKPLCFQAPLPTHLRMSE